MIAELSATALLGGCGTRGPVADPSGSHSNRLDSGIRGLVVLGPTCPVERPGQTCVRPYQATIVSRSAATNRFVARVRSSASGRFRIALVPGSYVLVPQSGRPFPRAAQRTVTVPSHRYANVVISYDTGIR